VVWEIWKEDILTHEEEREREQVGGSRGRRRSGLLAEQGVPREA